MVNKYSILMAFILCASGFYLLNIVNGNSEIVGIDAEARDDIGSNFEHAEEEEEEKIPFIPVLMYHHFVDEGEETSYTTIRVEEFEGQITYLKAKGYTAITDQDLVDFYETGKELPEKPIHITMDDGYESNYKLAYPILRENGMKATIFLIVSRMEKQYSIPRFNWEEAKEMSDSGIMSIQSHSYDLHHKEEVEVEDEAVSAMIAYHDEVYFQKVRDDLILSRQIIEEKLEKEVIALAYPYGHYDENTLSAVEEAGFKVAYTVRNGVNTAETPPLELNRINVSPGWTGQTIENEIEKQRELLSPTKKDKDHD